MTLTIGRVATRARVNIQTVRYYERRGLIPPPARTPSGYRQFSDDAVARIRFIKRAQDLGFSLKEIAGLLALRVDHETVCGAVEQQTRAKIALVEQKIRELEGMKAALERLVGACETRKPTGDCPIIETLDQEALANG